VALHETVYKKTPMYLPLVLETSAFLFHYFFYFRSYMFTVFEITDQSNCWFSFTDTYLLDHAITNKKLDFHQILVTCWWSFCVDFSHIK
jgi:hypothetical protein